MRHLAWLTPLLVLASGASEARVGNRAGVHDLLGCYRLTLGPWSQGARPDPPSPTEVFRLDSASVRGGPPDARATVRLVPANLMPPTDPRAKWLRPPWWRLIGSDSLEIITWTTATEGEVFYGHIDGAGLRGVLRRTNDVMQVDPKTKRIVWDAWPWAQASARRVSCP